VLREIIQTLKDAGFYDYLCFKTAKNHKNQRLSASKKPIINFF